MHSLRHLSLVRRSPPPRAAAAQVSAPIAGDWALYNSADNQGELLGQRW